MLLRHLHLFHSFFIAIIFAYDYRKNFQAFQHESVADIIADFAPETEEDDFKLEHVLSGKEALQMERGIKTTNNVGSLPFEMSLLQYPKASGKAFPTHRIKFTSGLGSFLQEYSEKPADFAEALSRFSAAPGILPRPDDHETVKNFALMCSNAYIIHSILGDWRNITDWEQVFMRFYVEYILIFRRVILGGMELGSEDTFLQTEQRLLSSSPSREHRLYSVAEILSQKTNIL